MSANMDPRAAWDLIVSPRTMTRMRLPPVVPVTRLDFTLQCAALPAPFTDCRLYYTVPEIKDPGDAPIPPVEPAEPPQLPPRSSGRPSAARRQAEADVAAYPAALAAYPDQLAAYEEALLEHEAQVNAYEASQVVHFEEQDPEKIKPDIINTHGRGSNLDNGAVVAFTEGISRMRTVLSFQDFGDLNHRAATFRHLLNAKPSAETLAGRSMGARAAARAQLYTVANKLIFFTYPLVRGRQERYEELLQLGPELDVLFVVGDEDSICVELHLQAIRKRMKARSWWLQVVGGNHAMNFDMDKIKRPVMCNVAGQIAAAWSMDGGRDPEKTELLLDYEKDTQRAVWTAWRAPEPESAKEATSFKVDILNSRLPGGGGNISFSLPP